MLETVVGKLTEGEREREIESEREIERERERQTKRHRERAGEGVRESRRLFFRRVQHI